MAWSLVQAPVASSSGAWPRTKAFASNVTAGNLLVILSGTTAASASVNSASDTIGTVWQTSTPWNVAAFADTAVIYWGIAPSSAANTITFGWTAGAGGDLYVAEFSLGSSLTGLAADGTMQGFDQTVSSTSLVGPALNVSTGATSPLAVGYSPAGGTNTKPATWTTIATTINGDPAAFFVPAGSGAFTPTWSQSPSGTGAAIAIVLDFPGAAAVPFARPSLPLMAPQGGL